MSKTDPSGYATIKLTVEYSAKSRVLAIMNFKAARRASQVNGRDLSFRFGKIGLRFRINYIKYLNTLILCTARSRCSAEISAVKCNAVIVNVY